MRCAALLWIGFAAVACVSSAQLPAEASSGAATFGTTVVLAGGLHGTIYLIPTDTTVLPDFPSGDGVESVGEIWTEALNIVPRHWRAGFPGVTKRFEWFAIDYDARFWIDQPGRYTFALISDDGSRLFLDDTPVIDNDCQHPPDLRIAAVNLAGGGHRIRVSYFQGPRDCLALVLAVAGPDERWKLFNTAEFKPPSNPEDWVFPSVSQIKVVPTRPDEAVLGMKKLLQNLEGGAALDVVKGCLAAPVRSCSR